MATLTECLRKNQNAAPSAAAVIVPGPRSRTVTHQELAGDVAALQSQLAGLRIGHESKVSIQLGNSYEFMVAFLAVTGQRAIAAPLNPAYKREELEFFIRDLQSDLVIVPAHDDGPRHEASSSSPILQAAKNVGSPVAQCFYQQDGWLGLKPRAQPSSPDPPALSPIPSDVALILHTSGTTGRPKAVPLTHRNLTRTIENIQKTYKLSRGDRGYLVMPLFHVHGLLAGFLAPLAAGGSVVVPRRFSASDFWHDFCQHGANWYTAVPTIHQIMLKHPVPDPLPKIRFIRSCSSPLAPEVLKQLQATFQAPVVEAYAMTEAAHQVTSNPLGPGKLIPGSVGVAQGVEVAILDEQKDDNLPLPEGSEGEICIRGENVTEGYLNNPEANKKSFTSQRFFRTGDRGRVDAQGYLYITGRIKELVNKGGEKFSPVEIDNLVLTHRAVSECTAFAVEDPLYGQDVSLAVVLNQGCTLTPAELIDWLRPQIAKFKIPRRVYITDTMPKTATGKIQRNQVAAEMMKKFPEPGPSPGEGSKI